ncbi:MAG: lysylphosphatidylglycerol synthase transmembrane domain-containing protein [Candidatus Kapaibacterium sp.]
MKGTKLSGMIFFVLGFAILTYLVIDLGVDKIYENILKTGWWFIPVVGIWLFIYLLNAFAWNYIIGRKYSPGYGHVLGITVSGFAINYITPFVNLGGEPYRIMALKEATGIHKAVSSVILYTMMHMFSHIIFWVITIFLYLIFWPMSDFLFTFLSISLAVLLLLLWFFFTRYKAGVLLSFTNLVKKLKFLKKINKIIESKQDSLKMIDDQIKYLYFNRPKAFIIALGLEFIGRIMAASEFYFIILAVNIEASFPDTLMVYSGVTLFTNILFFMPLQLGSREGGLYIVFESMGISPEMGVFVSLITRIRELFWILIGLLLIKINNLGNHKNRIPELSGKEKELLDKT